MKYLLIPLAFVATGALACPGDAAKHAAAPAMSKEAAAKAAPAPARTAAAAPAAKATVKVAATPAADARKPAPL